MWLERIEFLCLSQTPLPYVLLKTSSISTIRAPSRPYLSRYRARPLAAKRPDQRQSLKAIAETRHRFAAAGTSAIAQSEGHAGACRQRADPADRHLLLCQMRG